MTFRKILFWFHLCTGVVVGTVVSSCQSRVSSEYEKQMTVGRIVATVLCHRLWKQRTYPLKHCSAGFVINDPLFFRL